MADHDKPKLSRSGNPQIAKGDGDAPVRAYLDAMPEWKAEVGHRVDQIVAKIYPGVRKAVRWNTPFYGKEDGWFMSMYCYNRYVQLAFLRGAELDPTPPGASKVDGVRYFNIYKGDDWDEAMISDWVSQAVRLPGVNVW